MHVELKAKVKVLGNYKEKKSSYYRLCESAYPNIVEPKSVVNWEGALVLPDIMPNTSFDMCKIINLNYFLEFKFSVSGPSMNTKLVIPIIIGTIKLDD